MRVVFAPWGSFGDLHPYLAVAIEMKSRGHNVLIATSAIYREKVESEGLPLYPVRPDMQPYLDDPEAMAKVMHRYRGPERLFRGIIMPAIRDSFEDLREAANGADLLVSHVAMCAAPIVAESLNLRWVSIALQPAVFWSATDPSYFPLTRDWIRASPVLATSAFWLMRGLTNQWMKPVYRLRQDLGLRKGSHPLFEGQFSPWGTLAWFSPLLAPPQPDWPQGTIMTGFPFYDKLDATSSGLSPELDHFIRSGEPPIVFTLGTSAAMTPGNFYETSASAATLLRRRAVLLAGRDFHKRLSIPQSETIKIADYAPYSAIFPLAAAVVHSGGIGTTAQALRAGRPMVVAPFSHDQPDNGARITRLGVGKVVPRNAYTTSRIVVELQALLASDTICEKAAAIGKQIQQEDGIRAAADALEHIRP
jgi:rhamnosyltransferase subunit B